MLTGSCKRLFFYLSLAVCVSAHAQDLQQKLDSFSGQFIAAIKSQERAQAYLITDKSVFRAGESIWFRAFLLNAISQKVNTKSNYLFVDLVNAQDSVISVVLLDAANQQLEGRIVLHNQVAPGSYWLRAYTRQMVEGDTNSCYIKPIYIINKNSTASSGMAVSKTAASTADSLLAVQFYPEGGAIMTGTNTTVAFLIQDAKGNPVVARGVIKDNQGAIVARFYSNTLGLSKFEFSPSRYKTYKAYLNRNGKEISYPLPAYNFHAGQLALISQDAGKLRLRVLLEDSLFKTNKLTYVVGVSKDSLCFAGIGRGLYELDVAEQKFSQGIATFYLFDSSFRYVSERSVYINEDNVQVRTTLDNNVYDKRDNVALTVSITDAANNPLPALLSVAVMDSVFENPSGDCVPSGFNDVRQVNNFDVAHLQCLTGPERDLLMLVRNPSYQKMLQHVQKTAPANEDSLLYIKGAVLDGKGNPAAYKILTLLSGKGGAIFLTDTTDASGRFSFPTSHYMDSTQFAIEAKDVTGKSIKVTILRDPIIFPHFSTPVSLKHPFSAPPVFTNTYRQAYLNTENAGVGKSLPEVMVKSIREVNYNALKRVSSSSIVITPDMLDERRSLGDIILNVGGLHMLQGYLVIGGLTAMKAPDAGSEPLLLIDGVQAPNAGAAGQSPVMNTLNSISPKDVEFIEILKGAEAANYGVRGGNGVILVNMVSSRRENFSTTGNNLQRFYAKGISRPVLFPVVHYDNAAARSAESIDNRSTIFWDGTVLSSTKEPVRLHFFTTDVPTTYKVVINGITVHGDIIYKTLTFYSK